jgi:hypothetical protein
MSDAAYDARLADANAYIDTFITERRKGANSLLEFAEQAKKEAAAKSLDELSMGAPRPDTPNTTIVPTSTPGVNTLGQIGLARFGPGGGRRKSKRRKSKRTSKSKKSRR